MINVTKTYLPSREKFKLYTDKIFESGWLTNNGSLLQELESRLAKYLGVRNIILVSNGSLALQVAYKALGIKGSAITTPFTFAATVSTLVWENIRPIFADISPDSLAIDERNIERLIENDTTAIVPVHVFGNPCQVEKIDEIAHKHGLKVVYDAAHAFNVWYEQGGSTKNILEYGDVSTISFHSTKLFHSIEGGAIITKDDELAKKIRLLINFGISGPENIAPMGTNAKMNEFQAAMGLCVLDEINQINKGRKRVFDKYKNELKSLVTFQLWNEHSKNNYAYAPVLFKNQEECLKVIEALRQKDIQPRRYFFPSLDTVGYGGNQICPISRDVADRILCLPLYPTLDDEKVQLIIDQVKLAITSK